MFILMAAASLLDGAQAEVPAKYRDLPECAYGHVIARAKREEKTLSECADDYGYRWYEARTEGVLVKIFFRSTNDARFLIRSWLKDEVKNGVQQPK